MMPLEIVIRSDALIDTIKIPASHHRQEDYHTHNQLIWPRIIEFEMEL